MDIFQAAGRREGQRGSWFQSEQSSLLGTENWDDNGRTRRLTSELEDLTSEARFP